MEEILHHLTYRNLVNNGINYLATGAGFLPSTVVRVFGVSASGGILFFCFLRTDVGTYEICQVWSMGKCR